MINIKNGQYENESFSNNNLWAFANLSTKNLVGDTNAITMSAYFPHKSL